MAQFSIVDTIKAKPSKAEKFHPIILENAAASLRDEAECLKFDVFTYEDNPEIFVFYEVYTDAERDVERCMLIS